MDAHPLAERYPLMDDASFARHKADIAAHGCRMPIILFQGKILDGRNRYRACRELGVDFKFEEFRGSEAEASEAVDSWNLERRHLTIEDRNRRWAEKHLKQGMSLADIAKEAGVGKTTVHTAIKAQVKDLVFQNGTLEPKLESAPQGEEADEPAEPLPPVTRSAPTITGFTARNIASSPKRSCQKQLSQRQNPSRPLPPGGATNPRSVSPSATRPSTP